MFLGGSAMAERVRTMDWSRTPLGPIEHWPPSLRTSVSTCLESRFPILIWWGPQLVKIYNDAYAPMLGNKHPHALGRVGREVWPEIWDIIGPMLAGVLERGEATWSENQMLPLQRSGFVEECYFTYSYSPIRDEAGRIAGVYTAVSEVTQQVLTQRRLRTLQRISAPASSTEREACACVVDALATATDDIPFAVLFLHDADGVLSPRGAMGVPVPAPPDVVPTSAEPVIVEDDDARAWLGTLPGGPWPEQARAAIVQRLATADRPLGVLVTGASPRLRLDGAYLSFLRLLADRVANTVQAARSYDEERERAAALAEFDRAKTRFFSNVSHEFRTPLTLLLGPMQDALSAPEHALAGANLDTAYRNAQRLLRLVNQLLDFSRIEAQRARVDYQPADLAALTADLASAFRSAIERGGLALDVQCPPLSSSVQVDPEMWEKIVLNLISNAFKFTFAGTIHVGLHEDGHEIELVVRDTGVGIAPHELPRVFERFHRIEGVRSRTHEGSGIGLALVKDLVELHGGTISVASELGRGTTFRVRIPRRQAASALVATASAQTHAFVDEALRWLPQTEPPASKDGARIVIADDNADMRGYLARLVGEHWAVTAVENGMRALEAVRADPPDLVLTDVMMPELDGFGLIAALRADPATAAIPVIVLSARAGEEAMGEGRLAGADDYIAKPFTASALLVRIEAQLAAARARNASRDLMMRERQRLYAMLDNAPAAVCFLRGPELVIEVANRQLLRTWTKTEAIVGRRLLDILPELADQPFPRLLHEVRTTRRAWSDIEAVARIDRGNGLEEVYYDYIYTPVTDDDGVMVFAVDVTQKVLARQRLEHALDELRTANAAKDDFMALLGHELRNPLAPIMTAIDLMQLKGHTEVEREAAIIGRQTQHLSRLVDDLLDVSRIARGKVELQRRVLELSEVVLKGVELASPLFEQKRHRLELQVPRGIFVDGDPVRLAQVVSNLLVNAAKYTKDGGNIALTLRRDGDHAVIDVRDNGIGIAPDMLPRIFERFVQERQGLDRSRGGLGLGLTIVKSLVDRHGGTVTARSEGRDRGSTFEVRLPLHERARRTTSDRPPLVPVRAPRRVLVVDDNVDAARMLADAVARLGHEIRIAHDGPSALEAVRSFTPEIALLDIGLPVMDGYELGRRLRTEERMRTLRLVAISGYGQPSDSLRSHELGFDAHLVKPVDFAGLARLIDDLLPDDAPSVQTA